MVDSILDSTKKILGLAADYTAFDLDIITHINTTFTTLHDLGIGPDDGFMIEDNTAVWGDYLGTTKFLSSVRTYIYLKVRMYFDPPSTSYAIDAMKTQIQELEWRINVQRETVLLSEDPSVADGGDPSPNPFDTYAYDGGEL